METVLAASVFLVTSCITYLIWRKRAQSSLVGAFGKLFEFTGLLLLFFLFNTIALVVLSLSMRGLGIVFVSLYLADDPMILIFSAIQALVFGAWLERNPDTERETRRNVDISPNAHGR